MLLARAYRMRGDAHPARVIGLAALRGGAEHVDSLIAGAMTLEVPDDLRSRIIAALTGTAPAQMPPYLAKFHMRPDLADLISWAGITHQGR